MKFDVPGRKGPMKVILWKDRERIFDMPYETTDEVEIRMLQRFPLTEEVIPRAIPTRVEKAPEPEEVPTVSTRTSRKEV